MVDNFAVNTASVFAAIKAAHAGRKDVVFIYTGNFLNQTVLPDLLSLGAGKAASSHILNGLAAKYGSDGARYVFSSDRRLVLSVALLDSITQTSERPTGLPLSATQMVQLMLTSTSSWHPRLSS